MKEKILKLSNLDLNYKYIKNKENSNNILILHWWWWTSDSWQEIWDKLYNKWFNVIIPDLPWFWKTELKQVLNLSDYANIIEEFIVKLKLNDFMLYWHSNWWAISIELVNRWKIKPSKLILNNSAWIRHTPQKSFKKIFLKIITYPFKIFYFVPGYSKIRELIYRLLWAQDYINAEKNDFLKKTFQNMLNSDLKEKIKNINLSTIIIWWEQDVYTPVLDWYKIHKWIKNSKLVILKNERHGIHLQNPKLLVKTIINNI